MTVQIRRSPIRRDILQDGAVTMVNTYALCPFLPRRPSSGINLLQVLKALYFGHASTILTIILGLVATLLFVTLKQLPQAILGKGHAGGVYPGLDTPPLSFMGSGPLTLRRYCQPSIRQTRYIGSKLTTRHPSCSDQHSSEEIRHTSTAQAVDHFGRQQRRRRNFHQCHHYSPDRCKQRSLGSCLRSALHSR